MEATREEVFYEFSVNYAKAKMKIEEDQYIVLKRSTAAIENRPSAMPAIKKMRKNLVNTGVLKQNIDKNLYEFTSDYILIVQVMQQHE